MQSQRKTCTKCGEAKLLNEYYKSKLGKHGVSSRCKTCLVEYQRSYEEANREKVADYNRRYREANREKVAEQKRRYREANREKVADYNRRYWESNRDQILEQNRRYWEGNREARHSVITKKVREQQNLSEMFATVRSGTPYLSGEDALILADNGMTMYQKAIELGRTYHSVSARRKRLLAERENQ